MSQNFMHALVAQGRQTKNLCKTKPDPNTHTKKKNNLENDANVFQILNREIEVEVFFLGHVG
jgi:hypothetical protein